MIDQAGNPTFEVEIKGKVLRCSPIEIMEIIYAKLLGKLLIMFLIFIKGFFYDLALEKVYFGPHP